MDRYTQLKTIGKGSFGTVTLVRRNADGKVLVWKELDYGKMTEREKKHVVTEVNLLRELRHPYIVKYCDRIIDKQTTKLYIVMAYCPGGDLGKLIKKHRAERSYIKEKYIWKFVSQLVLALEECHMHKDSKGNTKPILHRDIKPANIFIDTSGDVKLGDFGLARELSSESKFAETYVGTPYYMSPELISQLKYNKTCDIWAVGCLAYELAALRPPFEASNHLSLALKISEGRFPRIPSRYSDALQQFIQSALQVNQMRRPTINQLKLNPHLQQCMVADEFKVREAAFATRCAAKEAELKRREEALDRREHDLKVKEAKLLEAQRETMRMQQDLMKNPNRKKNPTNSNNTVNITSTTTPGTATNNNKAGLAPVPSYKRASNVPSSYQPQQQRAAEGGGAGKRYEAPAYHHRGGQPGSAYGAIAGAANHRGPRVI